MKRTTVAFGTALILALSGTAGAALAANDGQDWTRRVNEVRVSDAIPAYEVDGTDDSR